MPKAWFEEDRPKKKKPAPAPAKKREPQVGEVEVERKSRSPGGRDSDQNTLAPGEFKKRRDTIDMLRQRAKPKKK
jgi:hypothetical protein